MACSMVLLSQRITGLQVPVANSNQSMKNRQAFLRKLKYGWQYSKFTGYACGYLSAWPRLIFSEPCVNAGSRNRLFRHREFYEYFKEREGENTTRSFYLLCLQRWRSVALSRYQWRLLLLKRLNMVRITPSQTAAIILRTITGRKAPGHGLQIKRCAARCGE